MAVTTTLENNGNHLLSVTVVDTAGGGTPEGFEMGQFVYGITVQRVDGSGTYTVEGSQDGTTYGALSTPLSTVNDDNLRAVVNAPRFLRVTIAAAAATVILTGVGP